jgi:hypothetical protein
MPAPRISREYRGRRSVATQGGRNRYRPSLPAASSEFGVPILRLLLPAIGRRAGSWLTAAGTAACGFRGYTGCIDGGAGRDSELIDHGRGSRAGMCRLVRSDWPGA